MPKTINVPTVAEFTKYYLNPQYLGPTWYKKTRMLGSGFLRINWHCIKSGRIRNYFGPYSPTFGLNREIYGVSLRIRENTDQKNSEYRKFFTQCGWCFKLQYQVCIPVKIHWNCILKTVTTGHNLNGGILVKLTG